MTSADTATAVNKAVIHRFMTLFSDGRLDEAFVSLSDDMCWSMWGSGPGAGDYTKAAMRDLLEQSWAWFDGAVTWLPTRMTAEEDRVMVEARSSAHTKGGFHHQNIYHNLFRVRDGLIVEIKEMFQEQRVALLFEQITREAGAAVQI